MRHGRSQSTLRTWMEMATRTCFSASSEDDKVAAYDNQIGESGTDTDGFGNALQITASANVAQMVYATDLNGDSYPDVVAAYGNQEDVVAWFGNLLYQGGTFSVEQRILPTDRAKGAHDVNTVDLDNDGDPDVVSASELDDKIAWYENDGSGGFGPQQAISTDADGASSIYTTDLDGDGDPDVVSASELDDKIA